MARTSAIRNRKQNARPKKREKAPRQVRKQTSAARIEMPASENRRDQGIRRDAAEHANARDGGAGTADPVGRSADPAESDIGQVALAYQKAVEFTLDAIRVMSAMSCHSLRTWQAAWSHNNRPQQ